jgi:Coenzyme PQQ synthesis protein D (PqqD)
MDESPHLAHNPGTAVSEQGVGVPTRFQVNSPRVMHETIEGEVMVIDLATGSYYSLRHSGAVVWQGIERSATDADIARELAQRYDASPDDVSSAVSSLLGELEAEGLVERVEDVEQSATIEIAEERAGGGREPFDAPVLEKHTDMQDLILLDPVHEVDAQGWPHPAPPQDSARR